MEIPSSLVPMLATGLMAMTLAMGGKFHPLQSVVRDRRVIVSFGAGIAAAYLFLGMMPELAEGMAKLDSMDTGHDQVGLLVYVSALLGFVIFYGLDHSTRPIAGAQERAEPTEGRVYGYGLYVWLMTYVMVLEAGESAEATLLYAFAMCFHFLTIDHSLSEKRGVLYERRGRFLLAFCTVMGWSLAQVAELSTFMTTLALGFVSGALTVNSAILELSEGLDGRFFPFALGSLFYGALLVGVSTFT